MAKVLYEVRNRHHVFGGELPSGWLPSGASQPLPTPIRNLLLDFEIVQEDPGSFLLIWSGPEPGLGGDTWYATVRDAMDQAQLAFGISPNEWVPVQS